MATATRSVVFTDLSGYTAWVVQGDRESLRDLLARHEAAVAPRIRSHNGRIVKTIGDSFMALFESATDAVRAALEIVEEGGLALRVSIATGDVEEIGSDVYGEAVNLSSRINHEMPPSEVWFSESTLLCLKQAEIPWQQMGCFEFKGITGETPLYRAIPSHKVWLPPAIVTAARQNTLALIGADGAIPPLPPDATLLIHSHAPSSESLATILARLPVVEPSRIWLLAYTIAPGDRYVWERKQSHGLVIGRPEALFEALRNTVRLITQTPSSDTIILETGVENAVELSTCGLALPEVPIAEVISGYSYELLPDGRWVNHTERPLARVLVSTRGVEVQGTGPGVALDGRPLPDREQALLKDNSVLLVGERRFVYRETPGSPYLGLLFAEPLTRLLVAVGQVAEIGREPQAPGIAIPDRRGQQNIVWSSGARAARVRDSGFTLDRALTGRHQASIVPQGATMVVEALHPTCHTFHFRSNGLLERVEERSVATFGEAVVVGTSIIGMNPPPR